MLPWWFLSGLAKQRRLAQQSTFSKVKFTISAAVQRQSMKRLGLKEFARLRSKEGALAVQNLGEGCVASSKNWSNPAERLARQLGSKSLGGRLKPRTAELSLWQG